MHSIAKVQNIPLSLAVILAVFTGCDDDGGETGDTADKLVADAELEFRSSTSLRNEVDFAFFHPTNGPSHFHLHTHPTGSSTHFDHVDSAPVKALARGNHRWRVAPDGKAYRRRNGAWQEVKAHIDRSIQGVDITSYFNETWATEADGNVLHIEAPGTANPKWKSSNHPLSNVHATQITVGHGVHPLDGSREGTIVYAINIEDNEEVYYSFAGEHMDTVPSHVGGLVDIAVGQLALPGDLPSVFALTEDHRIAKLAPETSTQAPGFYDFMAFPAIDGVAATRLSVDSRGDLWVTDARHRLFRYEPDEDTWTRLVPHTAQQFSEIASASPDEKPRPPCGASPWDANAVYTAGDAVEWQGQNYVAWYWTQGDDPEYFSGPQTTGLPWGEGYSCVCEPDCEHRTCGNDGCGGSCGSCGTGEVCEPEGECVGLPGCTATDWSPSTVYYAGDTVTHAGFEYTAHYWTQGQTPDLNSGPQSSGLPWSAGAACVP